MTTYHRLRPSIDNLNQEAGSSLFSDNSIAMPDRFPAVAVPAPHLPTNGSPEDTRLVTIRAYEVDEADYHNKIMSNQGKFSDKKIVFAS